MLFDARSDLLADAQRYDVAVVGAGAVGLCLAVALARKGVRVALLEAGPVAVSEASQALFRRASASGHALPGLHLGRFRSLGGTTNFWGGQLVPLSDHVMAARPWIGSVGWPITPEDLAPYWHEAYGFLGMGAVCAADDAVWSALGVLPPAETALVQPFFTRWVPEANFARLFAEDIACNDNLDIWVNAQVTALVAATGAAVTAVEIAKPDGSRSQVQSRHVVLANGTIEIARLLQLPLHDGRPAPWAGNAWLGRGFADHLDLFAGSVRPIDRRRFSEVFENGIVAGIKYNPKLRLQARAQRERGLLDVAAHIVYKTGFADHLGNLKILAKGLMRGRVDRSAIRHPLSLLASLRFVMPMVWRYIRYRRILSITDGGIQLRLTCEQSVQRASRITLRDDCDAAGVPNIDVNWQIADRDLETLAQFAEITRDYLRDQGLAEVEVSPDLLARAPKVLQVIDDANHHMGGARMGASADQGVTDRDCAVFGAQGLSVAGAALFPGVGFANPTFTAIALAMRLARHLQEGSCR